MIAFKSVDELPIHLQQEFPESHLPDLATLDDDETIKIFYRQGFRYRVSAATSDGMYCYLLRKEEVENLV